MLRAVSVAVMLALPTLAQEAAPILINKAFEGGSLGKVEKLGDTEFRLSVEGQWDERGRNRQPTWFYFRMDHVAGRELTLILTDLAGEYNDRPVVVRTGNSFRPVVSEDNVHWAHVADTRWEVKTNEITLKLRPKADSVWLAYQAPYPYSRIRDVNAEINRSPHARVEVIGQTVLGRSLETITVTDLGRPDADKKHLWFIARQHAWESGTSFVMEAALRFIVSEHPDARRVRERAIFTFVPTMDPDGCAVGNVRFNVNGYDLNRNWNRVDLRDKQWLAKMPEIWYVKQAIRDAHARRRIDLLVNLHNNQGNEYLETIVDADPALAMLHRLFSLLRAETIFDPSRPSITLGTGAVPTTTTNSLWREFQVPTTLIEQRIGNSPKLSGRLPLTEDRLTFGPQLLNAMVKAVE